MVVQKMGFTLNEKLQEVGMNKNLSTSNLIGGIGALLLFLSCLFFLNLTAAGIISLVGEIFLLYSLNKMSKIFYDNQIFRYALIWFYMIIIRTIFILVAGKNSSSYIMVFDLLVTVGVYYVKNAFSLLSLYTKVPQYRIGGLLYFVGMILMLLGEGGKLLTFSYIGLLVISVAWAIIAFAFFRTPNEVKNKA